MIPRTLVLFLVVLQFAACCDAPSIPKHTHQLYSSAAKERNDGALALARCGSDAASAVERLGQLLYDDNVGVQSAAAYALRKIATPRAEAILEAAEKRRERSRKK